MEKNSAPMYLPLILVIVALFFKIIPWPHVMAEIMPQWVLLVTLLSVLLFPEWCGVTFAFIVGVLTDCVTGSLLGQHAFVFVLLSYLVLKASRPIRCLPQWQQSMLIGFFACLNLLLQQAVAIFAGGVIFMGEHWLSIIASAFAWPILMMFFYRFQRRRATI